MRVISRRRLREFWDVHRDAEGPLRVWEGLTKAAEWSNWAELKQTFGSADAGGSCVVFDVANNRLRLIGRVFYGGQRVYVLKVMTHSEYDRKDPKDKRRAKWEMDCRCHERRPGRKP